MSTTFHCVDDGVPEETTRYLRMACDARGVEFVAHDAPAFDYRPERRLAPGDLLYRPAVSVAAMRVEQFLFNDGVGTFHRTAADVFTACATPHYLFARAGLPMPDTIPCSTAERAVLRGYVERLGGFPVILKVLGRSGGIGVIRVDSFPTLFSLVDYVVGQQPLLMRFVAGATHFRVIVVGERAVGAYRNADERDDFRTHASGDAGDYSTTVEAPLAAVAVAAARAINRELAGVDILRDGEGRLFLLEANFPCYFGHAQESGGIDVAGAMVDHLLEKARRGGTRG